ncbi:MAG: arginine--tRNA ligase [Spirochaetaceae bacterium]|jgi:arginyl-tRNA synthetase|nr:arginine--tRNA ligase [Spirochaetaceae bacterium]
MPDLKQRGRELAAQALTVIARERDPSAAIDPESLLLETPPAPELGDVGIPLFPFAKILHMAPTAIAVRAAGILAGDPASGTVGVFFAAGPYLNLHFNRSAAVKAVLEKIVREGETYGTLDAAGKCPLAGRRVMVEFSSPNTNKPLHLGHLRNDALGESVSRILKAAGADVHRVNIINNRGIHICKSMLAYQKFHCRPGREDTPESLRVKSDRFVGDCYVEYDRYSKSPEGAHAEEEARALLVAWEAGDPAVRGLWERMNTWALNGVMQTYRRTGVSFDTFYFESDTYLTGKAEIHKGLESGLFYRESDGSVQVDLAEINLEKKVLLRSDGTSLYMTQDLGLAVSRHDDWDFNELVYVVGNEQQWHFKVLFYILKKLGYAWADRLFHLAYGMVNLPEGRMKSREGTVVDADDLLDSLRDGALEEIAAKGREDAVGDPAVVAERVALGALHYYLLQVSPLRDMLFNPRESLSFNGNTGPYLQYMGARLASILRKAAESGVSSAAPAEAAPLLAHDTEWELVKLLELFPAITLRAAESLDPSLLVNYLYDTAKSFGKFYHECPILGADGPALVRSRLTLARSTLTVLRSGMDMILVPFLQSM